MGFNRLPKAKELVCLIQCMSLSFHYYELQGKHFNFKHLSNLWRTSYSIHMQGLSCNIHTNAFAYTFEPKVWDYSIQVLKV